MFDDAGKLFKKERSRIMGLTTKQLKVSKEAEDRIKAAKLKAKALREKGASEEFSDDLTKEDEKYMQEFRKGLYVHK